MSTWREEIVTLDYIDDFDNMLQRYEEVKRRYEQLREEAVYERMREMTNNFGINYSNESNNYYTYNAVDYERLTDERIQEAMDVLDRNTEHGMPHPEPIYIHWNSYSSFIDELNTAYKKSKRKKKNLSIPDELFEME